MLLVQLDHRALKETREILALRVRQAQLALLAQLAPRAQLAPLEQIALFLALPDLLAQQARRVQREPRALRDLRVPMVPMELTVLLEPRVLGYLLAVQLGRFFPRLTAPTTTRSG